MGYLQLSRGLTVQRECTAGALVSPVYLCVALTEMLGFLVVEQSSADQVCMQFQL